MSRFENLKGQLEKLKERRNKLQGELSAAQEVQARRILDGKEPGPANVELQAQIGILDKAIMLAEEELAALELEEVHRQINEIEAKKAKLAADLERARKPYEAAKLEFQKAEQSFGATHFRVTRALEVLTNEQLRLQARAERLEGPEPPREVDPGEVEKILGELRTGARTSYVKGIDPTADAAYEAYEREIQEIKTWAEQNRLSQRTSGEAVPMPEAAKHYTKERLAELTKAPLGGGGRGGPKAAGGGLIRKAVPI